MLSMMIYNPDEHHRRSIRLKNYDYSKNGYYFITICTRKRECLFSTVEKNLDKSLVRLNLNVLTII